MRTCFIPGCTSLADMDADECGYHLRMYESNMASFGFAASPCTYGHYECAHKEGGKCHALAFIEIGKCPDRRDDCQEFDYESTG